MLQTTLRPKPCRQCGSEFTPARPLQHVCSAICATRLVKSKKKEEKAQDRVKREKMKSRAQWLAEAQTIVNRYVRLRAKINDEGCYTCGARPEQKFGGTFDASHFRSVGSAPHLRFWIPQIRICCVVCNRHKGGELLAFRRHLVAERGTQWVEVLESRQEVAKFTVDYLKRLKAVMSKKIKRLEKWHSL